MNIRLKILSALIPLLVVPLLALGWIAFEHLKMNAEQSAFSEMNTLLNQSALRIRFELETAEANIELFSESKLLRQHLLADAAERYDLWQPALLKLFSSYIRAYPDYYEIRVLLPDGFEDTRFTREKIPNVAEDEKDSVLFQQMRRQEETVQTVMLQNPDNRETAFYVARKLIWKDSTVDSASDKPTLRGYLVLTIRPRYVRQLVNTARIGRQGRIFFTDGEGKILFYPESMPSVGRLRPEQFLSLKACARGASIGRADFGGEPAFFRGMRLTPNLYLFGALPEKEILRTRQALKSVLVGITLASIFITTGMMFFFLNRFVVRPIRCLARVSRKLGKGDMEARFEVNTRDEIGKLGADFNKMAGEIQFVRRHLEETVASRTAELAVANRNLSSLVEELKAAKEAAESADRAKSDFMANMSHEFRTPLNAIIGFVELALEDRQIPERQIHNLTIARDSARTLFKLLKDIIGFVRMQSGEVSLHQTVFSPVRLTRQILDLHAEKIYEKKLVINTAFSPDLLPEYMGDSQRLGEILNHLVGNAVKFTREGGITVTVAPADPASPSGGAGASDHRIHFAVEDTGIGIPADRLKDIFHPFTQVDGSSTRSFGGAGLGASIAKELVEKMGGDIRAESVEGKGSVFHFTVMLKPVQGDTDTENECGK